MIKWQRNYKLYIYIPKINNGIIDENNADVIFVEYPIKCEFSVSRDTFSDTNKTNIKLYNLNATNRNKIFQDYININRVCWAKFYAGYGEALPLLTNGKIFKAYSYKSGTDIITELEIIDYGFLTGFSSYTFEKGSSKDEAIKKLVEDMENVKIGNMERITETFTRPYTVNGATIDCINDICGGGAFIDNGILNILKPNQVRGDVTVNKITSESGLLGSPRRQEALCEIEVVFSPELVVGQLVEFISKTVDQFNGTFKIVGLKHNGVISASESGTVVTTLNLFVGTQLPNTDFVTVNSYSIEEVTGNNVVDVALSEEIKTVRDVYNYIKKFKIAPNTLVANTQFTWATLLNSSLSYDKINLPNMDNLTNLYFSIQKLDLFQKKYYPSKKIQINSAWRSVEKNKAVKGVANSQHIVGRAFDFVIQGVSVSEAFNKLKSSNLFGWCKDYPTFIHADTRNISFKIGNDL